MDLRDKLEKKDLYIDFPPNYNEYGKQAIQKNLSSAIQRILRLLYTKKNTLSMVPDLYIDIEQYKHQLDDDKSVILMKQIVEARIRSFLEDMSPDVYVDVDKQTQSMSIYITLQIYSDIRVGIKINKAESHKKYTIEIDKKPFYA